MYIIFHHQSKSDDDNPLKVIVQKIPEKQDVNNNSPQESGNYLESVIKTTMETSGSFPQNKMNQVLMLMKKGEDGRSVEETEILIQLLKEIRKTFPNPIPQKEDEPLQFPVFEEKVKKFQKPYLMGDEDNLKKLYNQPLVEGHTLKRSKILEASTDLDRIIYNPDMNDMLRRNREATQREDSRVLDHSKGQWEFVRSIMRRNTGRKDKYTESTGIPN